MAAWSSRGASPPQFMQLNQISQQGNSRQQRSSSARKFLLDPPSIRVLDRRHHRTRALLPSFTSGDEAAHLATAASVASALTAYYLNSRWSGGQRHAADAAAAEPGPSQEQDAGDTAQQSLQQPNSIEEVWQTAWAGLESGAEVLGVPQQMEDVANEPLSSPLLWLQGLRIDARRRLLALSLAALESEIAASAPTAMAAPPLWPSACSRIIAASSSTAAAAWLGYVPQALEAACCRVNSSSEGDPAGKESVDDKEEESASGVEWYALEERMAVYCSVLRLLRSSSIAAASLPNDDDDDDGDGNLSLFPKETSDTRQMAAAALFTDPSSIAASSRGKESFEKVAGWRAAQAGTRSRSQLLSLAPSVLQDMAVRVADAVAAAYLEEAVQGSWAPAASPTAEAAAAEITTVTTSSPSGLGSQAAAAAASKVRQIARGRTPTPTASSSPSLVAPPASNVSVESFSVESSWWPAFAHPRLTSTRQMQRFANRVATARWVDRYFFSVSQALDDRLPLCTLTAPKAALRVRQAPVRRAAEVSSMKGARFAVALVLEAADLATPLLRALWGKAVEAVAWVLCYGVGKGLGLVWRGLRMGAKGRGGGGGGKQDGNGSPPPLGTAAA